MPTQEEWALWLEMSETQALRKWAQARREDFRDSWEAGNLSGAGDQFTYNMVQAKATGTCQVLREIEELGYEFIFADELEELERRRLEKEQQEHGEP